MQHNLLYVFALVCAALPVQAAGPEWLSKSLISAPMQNDLGPTRSTKSTKTGGITTEPITESPLETEQPDAIGILTSEQTGIPRNFWGDSDPKTIARLVEPYHADTLPEITALWQRITLTEIDAPRRGEVAGAILLARVDHLLNAGALDQAEALLSRAGVASPALFWRTFDVGLLTGRAQAACAEMLSNPSLTPGFKARIFCLARENDWRAAAITLTTAQALDQISQADADLLARFLDPDLFDENDVPPSPAPLTALDFVMREALAMPRTGQALPLAFLHADLRGVTGWRNQVIATERLVRAQALPAQAILDLYQTGKPAASGGVWVRVSAVQNLINAINGNDSETISTALSNAYAEMDSAGLVFVLANLAAEDIRDIPLNPQAAALRFRLWLLHPDYRELSFGYEPQNPQDQFLYDLAQDNPLNVVTDDIETAIQTAFTQNAHSSSVLDDARAGRLGEAVLNALTNLIRARHSDPTAVETAIAALLIAGLKDEARQIAIQIVLNQSSQT
jgi:hypothetical protein